MAVQPIQCKVCVVLAVLPENMIVIMYLQGFGLTSLSHSLLVNRFYLILIAFMVHQSTICTVCLFSCTCRQVLQVKFTKQHTVKFNV